MILNQWYAILPSKAVKTNQIVGVKRLNLDLAIFRNDKGEIGCVVDQCTHRGAALSKHDFVARLGGDEFLIIFEGLDENQSEEIWTRIVDNYNNVNETGSRKYLISVSHGIESFRCDSNQYIDAIVNRADEKMYSEKRQIKKDLKVLRNIEK